MDSKSTLIFQLMISFLIDIESLQLKNNPQNSGNKDKRHGMKPFDLRKLETEEDQDEYPDGFPVKNQGAGAICDKTGGADAEKRGGNQPC